MKSWLEVDAARLAANFRAVQAAAGERCEVLAVIKADAYGHGAALCAPVLVEAGARWLGVADVEEARVVRQALTETASETAALQDIQILVMCGFEPEDADSLVALNLTPVVWTPKHLHLLQAAAERADTRVRVHIEVDTGMARQGVRPGPELARLLEVLYACSRVRYQGLFTHLSSPEVHFGEQTAKQLHAFGVALGTQPQESLQLPEMLHLASTSGVDEGSTTSWLLGRAGDVQALALVRTGLALYGYSGYSLPPGGETAEPHSHLAQALKPVATWKTRILGLRDIETEDTVGYGATFTAQHPMRLALLPVGYADGFRREASSSIGGGWVIIAGQRAPVVGRVSMNLTMVDVTEITRCHEGDEVVLLGEGVTANDHARWSGTIPYDILCDTRAHRGLV